MPGLTPKHVEPVERITIKVRLSTHRLVQKYAKHLGGPTDADYVYAEAARALISRDKDFMADRSPGSARTKETT